MQSSPAGMLRNQDDTSMTTTKPCNAVARKRRCPHLHCHARQHGDCAITHAHPYAATLRVRCALTFSSHLYCTVSSNSFESNTDASHRATIWNGPLSIFQQARQHNNSPCHQLLRDSAGHLSDQIDGISPLHPRAQDSLSSSLPSAASTEPRPLLPRKLRSKRCQRPHR